MVSLLAFFVTVGVVMATTTIGTNIATDGTLTVYGVTSIGGALTATSTFATQGNSTFGNEASDINLFTGMLQASTTAMFTATSTFYGDVVLGDAAADTTIVNGRISTGSLAGSALSLGATYPYTEGAELRYTVTDWTGIGNSTFEALYLRSQINTANASGNLKGLELYASNNGVALGSIEGAYIEAHIKPVSDNTTVGPIFGTESNISLYGPSVAGKLLTLATTTTDSIGAAAGRFTLGLPSPGSSSQVAGLKYYDAVAGVLIETTGAETKTLGSGLIIRNNPLTSGYVYTWTKGIQVTSKALTGLSLEGAMTTGISISGASTNDISLQNLETITNSTNGTIRLANDGNAYIDFTPTAAGATITPGGTGTITIGGAFSVSGYATTTVLGVIVPVSTTTAPAACSTAINGGLSYDSAKKVLCICIGTSWLQATSTGVATCF